MTSPFALPRNARPANVALPVFGGPLDGIILTIRDVDYEVHAACQPFPRHWPTMTTDRHCASQFHTYRYSRQTVHLSWTGLTTGAVTGQVLIPVAPLEHREHAQHVVIGHLAYIALMLRWIGTNPRQPDQPHTHHPNM